MVDQHKLATRVSEDLHRKVKVKVAQKGTTISEVLRRLLAKWVEENSDDNKN